MTLTTTDRAKLVKALLDCDCMKTVNSRNSVIQDLSAGIQDRLRASGTSKQDVDELVRVCAQFPDGLEELLGRVKYFEGESYAWNKLEQIAREIMTEPATPSPAVPAVTPMPPIIQEKPVEEPIEVFFSYSHKDEALRDSLSTHLSILKRKRVINAFHDRQIPAGAEFAKEIDERMNRAQVILLLVSADFLASDYCQDIEMKRALERHESRESVVIPIILRQCDWKDALFGKLQALPKDARPVTSWANQDEAFTNVAEGIRRAVEGIRARIAPLTTS